MAEIRREPIAAAIGVDDSQGLMVRQRVEEGPELSKQSHSLWTWVHMLIVAYGIGLVTITLAR